MRKQPFKISRALALTALTGYCLWVVFPMIWVAYSSLKPDRAIFTDTFALPSPRALDFGNYRNAWREAHFRDYFLNSVLVTGVSVGLIAALVMGLFGIETRRRVLEELSP